MAYTTKYFFDHYSSGGNHYYGQLQKDGLIGTPEQIKLTGEMVLTKGQQSKLFKMARSISKPIDIK